MKKALIFGAGNIGRGFLGLELGRAGYELTFVDVVYTVLDEINKNHGYEVEVIDTAETRFVPVQNSIHVTSKENLKQAIHGASLIVTAVGPDNLKHVAKLLREPLYERAKKDTPLNIIACENMIGNSSTLKDLIISQADCDKAEAISARIGFPNSVVDRISVLGGNVVRVEESYEWIVEATAWNGKTDIACMRYVPHLEPFVMRKLYLLNGAHATLGFMGQVKGIELVHQALRNPEIMNATSGHLREANYGVTREYDLNEAEQEAYTRKVLQRFQNETLRDKTARLSKGQIRKLQRNERLIGPALLALKYGVEPRSIARGIAFLLRYFDPRDSESRELKNRIAHQGVSETLLDCSRLDKNHPQETYLVDLVEKEYLASRGP